MASGGSNPRELQDNLSNSEAQLHQVEPLHSSSLWTFTSVRAYVWRAMVFVVQVEAALTNDPTNKELLKLKDDLTVSSLSLVDGV